MAERLKKLEAAICVPTDDYAPSRQRAYAIEAGGEEWTTMTDGQVLVALKGAGGADDLPPMQVETFRRLLRQLGAADWVDIDLADLLVWLNSHPVGAKHQRTCPDCHGRKVVRCECDCGECSHEAECEECEGTGTTTNYPDPVRAWVYGVYMDLNLLHRVIQHLEPGACQVARGKHSNHPQDFDCIHLRSEAWRVTAMGLRVDYAEADAPRWEPATAMVSS